MTYELYKQNPGLVTLWFFASLIVTVLVYGAFPLIFANVRNKEITEKKYKRLCYGINIIGMAFFVALNGVSSGAPYLLWTWIFSRWGVNILDSRGVLRDSGNSTTPHICFCRKCGTRLETNSRFCRKCGTAVKTEE